MSTSKSKYKIILGSSSPARKNICEKHGLVFDVVSADINEKAIRENNIRHLPITLAKAKLEVVRRKVTDAAIIICADTVIISDGELREKPESQRQLSEWLESYANLPIEAITGIVVYNTATKQYRETLDSASVLLKPLPSKLIEELVQREDFQYASGGIVVEIPALRPYIKKVTGNIETLMGLPGELTLKLINELSQ